MPIYPGGYQNIDLGGITIPQSPDSVSLDPKPWQYAIQSKKPVIISNFICDSAFMGPLLLVNESNGQDAMYADLVLSKKRVIVSLADIYDGTANISLRDIE